MLVKRMLVLILSGSLLLATAPGGFADQTNQATDQSPIPVVKQTPEQLQLPIALYPDELVTEVLAAATYATQVVEADRWLQNIRIFKENSWPPCR